MKIVDEYGNEIGYQSGSDYVINDKFGSRLGWIDEMNSVFDTYGNKVGEIHDDGVYDKYGNHIGDVTGYAVLSLLVKHAEQKIYTNTTEEPVGLLGWIVYIFLSIWQFILSSLGGKIGVGLGIVLGVVIGIQGKSVSQGISHALIFGISLGVVGLIMEGIIRLIIFIGRFIAHLIKK
ncbi:MAG: hypothetical protein HDR32_06590 [Treponema sp.]|nr:hypothetical protein [Treponema sp.]